MADYWLGKAAAPILECLRWSGMFDHAKGSLVWLNARPFVSYPAFCSGSVS
jgi:hypothetical protein